MGRRVTRKVELLIPRIPNFTEGSSYLCIAENDTRAILVDNTGAIVYISIQSYLSEFVFDTDIDYYEVTLRYLGDSTDSLDHNKLYVVDSSDNSNTAIAGYIDIPHYELKNLEIYSISVNADVDPYADSLLTGISIPISVYSEEMDVPKVLAVPTECRLLQCKSTSRLTLSFTIGKIYTSYKHNSDEEYLIDDMANLWYIDEDVESHFTDVSTTQIPDNEQCQSDAVKPTVADTLIETILAERGSRYGKFTDNSDVAQQIKSVMRVSNQWDNLENYQKEALEMVAHKIGRILSGDYTYDDSWIDISGYITLVVEELHRVQK